MNLLLPFAFLAVPLAAQQWVPLSAPPLAPTNRNGAASVFDAARGRIVLLGGFADAVLSPQTVPLAEQWEFDGEGWAQVRPRNSPSPRYLHAMCFDPLRQRVLLFGGQDQPYHDLDDTWVYAGGAWTELTPAARPPVRRAAAIAFDSARDRVVLFGGVGAVHYGDTWEFDGATWSPSAATGPTAREGGLMAFDAARSRTVLAAGTNPGNSGLAVTWEFDGAAWTQFATAPHALAGGPMHFDPAAQRVVLTNAEWDGATWTTIAQPSIVATNPRLLGVDTARHERIATTNGADGRLVTARYDGTHWRSVARRLPGHMVWDAVRQRLLGIGYVEGGGETNIWQWDGCTLEPLGTSPAVYATDSPYPPIHDTGRDLLITFTPGPGGAYSWNDVRFSDWQRVGGGILPMNGTMVFGFDAQRSRLVLYGQQSGSLPQTWEFDGVSWALRSPAHQPYFFFGMNVGYDAARQRVVVFTGFAPDDTWTWDGVDWAPVPVVHHPTVGSMVSAPPMTFDAQRGVLVRMAGGQTWEFDGADWAPAANAAAPSATLRAYDVVRQRHVATSRTEAFEYAPGPRPLVTVVGAGCPSSSDVLTLDADRPAVLGLDTAVRLRGLPPEAGGSLLVTGFDDQAYNGTALPASLGPWGLDPACTLRLAPALAVFTTHIGGTAVVHFALPNAPALAGVRFWQQALVVDLRLATPAPFAITNAIAFVAGR